MCSRDTATSLLYGNDDIFIDVTDQPDSYKEKLKRLVYDFHKGCVDALMKPGKYRYDVIIELNGVAPVKVSFSTSVIVPYSLQRSEITVDMQLKLDKFVKDVVKFILEHFNYNNGVYKIASRFLAPVDAEYDSNIAVDITKELGRDLAIVPQ